jgi:acetoin utilization protein AcuB
MNVLDIMTHKPITIRVDKKLRDALELMEAHGIKHLPVMSRHQHLVGILSDRDCRHALNSPFTERVYWQNETLDALDVRTVMTPAPIVAESDISAMEATRLMLANNIGCLPVMRGETLIGIVTRTDLLIAFMNMHRQYEKYHSPPPSDTHNGHQT